MAADEVRDENEVEHVVGADIDDGVEDDIDDDWDWDTELGLLDPEPEPGPPRPWVAPEPYEPPPLERDLRVAVLGPDRLGEFVRACRASAGLSQRGLAAAAGVPQSMVGRLESGRAGDIQLATLTRLAGACGVEVVGATGLHRALLHTDTAQRHRDAGGRTLPAHLVNFPVRAGHGGWWGDDRYTHGRPRPRRSSVSDYRYRDLPPEESLGDAASTGAEPTGAASTDAARGDEPAE